ncbi:MAG: hypothetical protein EBZ77_02850 [Chitinophagia bacterium]|nr:hypothetical protein [Chitinophagia bacterium]
MILLATTSLFAQSSSTEYTNYMYDEMIRVENYVLDSLPKNTLRRVETGVMKIEGGYPSFVLKRYYYYGNEYKVHVFTDKRVKDIKLTVFSETSSGDRNVIKTVDKHTNANGTGMLGDDETVSFVPEDSGYIYIEVKALNPSNDVARFCAMTWSESTSSDNDNQSSGSSSGSTSSGASTSSSSSSSSGTNFFSIDNAEYCQKNSAGKYDDCNTEDKPSLFELNSAKTVFKHTTPTITSLYYVNSSEYSSDIKAYVYAVRSDVGNSYTFVVPDDGSYIAVFNRNATPNYMWKHHVKRHWTE